MPKVQPEYLETRKQQILDAAATCFSRDGFHQTTMQEVCEEANLSPGAVYRYFRSKEDIILAMCNRGHEEDAETIRETLSEGSTSEIFDKLVRTFFEGLEDRELCALTVELISEARRNPRVMASLQEGFGAITEPLTWLIRRAQEAGEVNPALQAEAVAQVMLAVYMGLVQQKAINPATNADPFATVVRSLFGGNFWIGPEQVQIPQTSSPAGVLQH